MTSYTGMTEAILRNERSLCSVPECGLHRKGISRFCHKHRKMDSLYGHPLQKRLNRSLHSAERQLVAEIFHSNSDHPGILSAVRWLQEWMDDAITGRKGPVLAAEDLRRLHDNGVTATDIVIESAAFFVFQQWNKHKFVNDDAIDIAASLAVLHLAPLDRKTGWSQDGKQNSSPQHIKSAPRKKVGKWIRSHLLDLFINLQVTIEANRNAEITTREAMRSPLTYPAKLIPTDDK